jgi:cysteine desulfurase / selenocysteine lyase
MDAPAAPTLLDVDRLRAEFPVLGRETRPGVPLVYLDSAATSQKPRAVLEAMTAFYEEHNANIHRGIHRLAEEATEAHESARRRIATFIGAPDPAELVFTRNATESINLVASTWGRAQLRAGDLIVLTEMEHHANLVPWQMLAAERGLQLAHIPVDPDGRLDAGAYRELLSRAPRLVAFTTMSNMLGTITPAVEMTAQAHAAGALVLLDAAQSIPHLPTDVRALGADFVVFSAHKMCGPTGIGVLYARRELLEAMPPYQGGGDMIRRVSLHAFIPNDVPYKFEAGTPAIAEAIGLGAAVDFLSELGMEAVHAHEAALTEYALDRLSEVPGLRIYGPPAAERGGLASFSMAEAHPHDVAQILDGLGVAVRAGHHCAMPIHEKLGLPATTRASFYLYTTRAEIDRLIDGLYKVKHIFA